MDDPKQSDGKKHLFKPGESGNPGGMSKERAELRRIIMRFGYDSINRIEEMARTSEHDKVRFEANKWIAEQCVGKALVSISGEDGHPVKVSITEDLVNALRGIVNKEEPK